MDEIFHVSSKNDIESLQWPRFGFKDFHFISTNNTEQYNEQVSHKFFNSEFDSILEVPFQKIKENKILKKND